MKVKFEGGPFDGQFREIPDKSDVVYASRLVNPHIWDQAAERGTVSVQAQTIEYRPAYVVFAEVTR